MSTKTKKPAAKKTTKSAKKAASANTAAKVLTEANEPLNAEQMIEAMATKGYWTSPDGARPWATLYIAILRDNSVKGAESRFTKTERGEFAVNG